LKARLRQALALISSTIYKLFVYFRYQY